MTPEKRKEKRDKYMNALKADPERYAEYLQKRKEYNKKYYKQKKTLKVNSRAVFFLFKCRNKASL